MENKINRDIFSKLKRIFSNDVIIYQNGKNSLATVDINQTQKRSPLPNNYSNGKYSPIFRGLANYGAIGGSPVGMTNEMVRMQMYNEYEMMDNDAIITSALDLIAGLSTMKNTEGNVLKISSNDGNIKAILENFFYEIIDIEFNGWTWLRDMYKYGDMYLYNKIVDKYGIIGVTPMATFATSVVQNQKNGTLTYNYNPEGTMVSSGDEGMYDNYEITHFKLNNSSNYYPYSRSYLDGARKAWQALTLMEDASLSHRLIRSGDKRQWFVDVGSIAPNEVNGYMQNFANSIKRTPLIDPNTGQYNLRYNIENIMEDYYFPTRGNTTGTHIENLAGLSFAGMEDVEYHKQKVYNALKIPKAFLSETSDLNGTSVIANTAVIFAQSIENGQRAFIQGLYKLAMVHLLSKGIAPDNNLFDFELSLTPPSIIYEQEQIATMKEKIGLMQDMLETNLYSSDYIYKNVAKISEDEMFELRDAILEDKRRLFRISQIENEGNDPFESGQSYGTPADLANLYNDKVHVDQSPDLGKFTNVEPNPEGRPQTHDSIVGTDNSNLGRDPIFKDRKAMEKFSKSTYMFENKVNIYKKSENLTELLKKSKLFNPELLID